MTFGPDEDKGARITDFSEFTSCLDYFHGQGYDEIDTARVYVGGKQEEWTARADYKARGFTLATKWYPNQPKAHEPEMLKMKCQESLDALKTESVDIFYLHVRRGSSVMNDRTGLN
jgi:aflatoxin B1 aldehyde reductase